MSDPRLEVRRLPRNFRIHGAGHRKSGQREKAVHVPGPPAQVVDRAPGVVAPDVHEPHIARQEDAEARDDAPVDKDVRLVRGHLRLALLLVQEAERRRGAHSHHILGGRTRELVFLRDGPLVGPLVKRELLFLQPASHGLDLMTTLVTHE